MAEQRDLFGATSSAVLSPCGLYRYRLGRRWAPGGAVCWILLNPSTADVIEDDPTIRRCIGFAKGWGMGGIEVVNLFALRATDPRALAEATDPVGPENDGHLLAAVAGARLTVCAWGARGGHLERDQRVLFRLGGHELHCLGLTGDGLPRHPLYLRADAPLVKWEAQHG